METKIKSLEKALRILECFTAEEPELGVTEISRKLNMHKSSVFNIIDTLSKCGYLEQNLKSGKYKLGLKVLQLSYNLYSSYDIRRALRPLLEEILHKVNEAVYLGVLYEEEVIYYRCCLSDLFYVNAEYNRNKGAPLLYSYRKISVSFAA